MKGEGPTAQHTPLDPPPRHEISLAHRSAAAAGASIVSALVVNPLDVVKTRIQVQSSPNYAATHAALLERWSFAECLASPARAAAPTPPAPPLFSGTLDALWRIALREGPASLWRGTRASLAMSVPMVGIYLPLYDALLAAAGGAAWAPLAAGTLSRTAAVFATAPFELVRTRLQAGAAAPVVRAQPCPDCACPAGEARGAALARARVAAAAGLWRGVGTQLARDVPFSALYWAMVEPARAALLPVGGAGPDDGAALFRANVAAGAAAGALAGAATTPLDVVKTRVQLGVEVRPGGDLAASPMPRRRLLGTLVSIAREEGAAGLFRGWSARAAKAAPACAIVLSSYEGIKHWHAQ
ncbi:MML1 [Auxenochlorella protothecoides x Auxenochlorella symbiontica]